MAQRIPLPLTVSCFSKLQIGFTFLVPAHPGSPGQRAVKRCVCVYLLFLYCKGKGKRSIAVRKKPHRYGNSRAIWDNTVLPATRQRWYSRLHLSWSWYSIKRPRRDARLSWPSWLVTRAFQFGQKKFRFDSIRFSLPNRFFRFDSIRQSDKFAASTLMFK